MEGGCEGAASPVRVLPAAPGQRSELLPGRARGAAAEAAEPELGCRGGGESRRPSRARRGEPRPRQPGPTSQPVPSHARRLLSPGAARRVLRPPRREAQRSGVISCFLLFFNLGRGEGEEGQVLQAPPPPRLGLAAAARLRLWPRARRATGAERTAAVPRAERRSPPRPSPSASRRPWRLGRLAEPVGVGPRPSLGPPGRPAPSPSPPPSLSSPGAPCAAGAGVRSKSAESLVARVPPKFRCGEPGMGKEGSVFGRGGGRPQPEPRGLGDLAPVIARWPLLYPSLPKPQYARSQITEFRQKEGF